MSKRVYQRIDLQRAIHQVNPLKGNHLEHSLVTRQLHMGILRFQVPFFSEIARLQSSASPFRQFKSRTTEASIPGLHVDQRLRFGHRTLSFTRFLSLWGEDSVGSALPSPSCLRQKERISLCTPNRERPVRGDQTSRVSVSQNALLSRLPDLSTPCSTEIRDQEYPSCSDRIRKMPYKRSYAEGPQ